MEFGSDAEAFPFRLQVNFLALAQAPDLARAAREELWALEAKVGTEDEEAATHAGDVERQRSAILCIDADARAESAVNKVGLRERKDWD